MTVHQHSQESVTYVHQSPPNVRLLLAGHRHVAEYRQPMVVARPHLLLTWIESGKGMVRDQTDHALKAGDWYVLFPDEVLWISTDEQKPMCYFWMGIACDDAMGLMRQCNLTPQQRVRATSSNRQTRQAFKQMIKHLESDSPQALMMATGCMWQLLGTMSNPTSSMHQLTDTTAQQQAVDQACQIMQHQYVHGINVSEVADMLEMDRSHLSTRFKAVMGLTMHEYLTQLRISRAQLLLRHSDLTVNQVAQAVGYREYRSFIRCFEQRTGRTPRGYANHARGQS
ncbi:MAG: AraC family transcriptional regulator [Phycisphaeraceae bacterium JB051]